jgi:AraC family transcriptional regulator
MQHSAETTMTVESELRGQLASVQLVRFRLPEPVEGVVGERNSYRLAMSLTPRIRNARGCYSDRWRPGRFERLGDVFMVPAGQVLRAMSDGGRQLSLICKLPADLVHTWLEAELAWTETELATTLDITNRAVSSLLRRLAEEARHPGLASGALVEAVTVQLAIELGRYSASAGRPSAAGGLAAWRLRLIDERLATALDPPTLSELAGLCNVSVRQLTRGFRASKDCSLGEYILLARMERARRMLATDNKIRDIAAAMGFASASSFSYAFRKASGQTPRQFRQTLIRPGLRGTRRVGELRARPL